MALARRPPYSTAGDLAGTDQIYVGSVQTGANDGYSIAAGDFQFPAFQQPFTATVNGSSNATLVSTLDAPRDRHCRSHPHTQYR
jgi:hypothetical protein